MTARYTLTAPRLIVRHRNTRIQGGTFKGDVYVEAQGFELVDATSTGTCISPPRNCGTHSSRTRNRRSPERRKSANCRTYRDGTRDNREELAEKIDRGEDFVLIEVLRAVDYEEGHLPGAINIPAARIGREAKERFDLDREIVVYCRNFACRSSTVASDKLDSLGFRNVFEYKGGKQDWKEAGLPLER